MLKLTILLFVWNTYAFAQKSNHTTYEYGQNGIELISTKDNETIIINNFNAKVTIREDIAQRLLTLYDEKSLTNNSNIIVAGNDANVSGKVVIQKKDKLTSVNFYYEKVEWKSGLTEVYRKPNS